MANKRRDKIVQLLDIQGSVHLNELTTIFPNVSSMTLRRDLIQLEKEGLVIRTLGGASRTTKEVMDIGQESAYFIRENEQKEPKMIIASKALPFLEKGRAIYFDSGSTIMALTKLIPDEEFTIITSGINIAQSILRKERPSVILLGGMANRNTLSTSGPLATNILSSLNVDVAFIAASGYSNDNHFTVSNLYEAELKKMIIAKARKTIVLLDHSKIGKSLPYTFATSDQVDVLISDATLDKDTTKALEGYKVTIL